MQRRDLPFLPRTRKKMCIVKGEEGMPFLCLASFPSYATLKGGGGSQYVPPGRGGGSFLQKKKGERSDEHDQTGVRYTMAAIYRKRSTSKAESRFVAPSYSHSPISVLPVLFRSEIRVEKTQSPHSPTPTSSAILRCSCPFLMEVFRSPPLDAAAAAAPVR